MDEYAWSDGSKPERSRKEDKPVEKEPVNNGQFMDPTTGFRQASTKRDEANSKLSERCMVGQGGYNPFLTETTYAQDIDAQQNFLIPRSSHDDE
jgi:hypothetical protein